MNQKESQEVDSDMFSLGYNNGQQMELAGIKRLMISS